MDRGSQLDEDDEDDKDDKEDEEEAGGRRRQEEEATDIKSNNPHLAGGEKKVNSLGIRAVVCRVLYILLVLIYNFITYIKQHVSFGKILNSVKFHIAVMFFSQLIYRIHR